MNHDKLKPFLKWAGGKRRFADTIVEEIRKEKYNSYFEPFLGGGIVFLKLKPNTAFLSDYNAELISTYNVIQHNFDKLKRYIENEIIPYHSEEFYYQIRSLDRSDNFFEIDPVIRAARFIYLNKTCFNGIYRVNKNNQFNVPFGKYAKIPNIFDANNLNPMNYYLTNNEIKFESKDFLSIEQNVHQNDLIYCDPPYDIDIDMNGFTQYTVNGFSRDEQKSLKLMCDRLIEKGAIVFISNSNTKFINDLYLNNTNSNYHVVKVFSIKRTIGSTKKSRRTFEEILIKGKKE